LDVSNKKLSLVSTGGTPTYPTTTSKLRLFDIAGGLLKEAATPAAYIDLTDEQVSKLNLAEAVDAAGQVSGYSIPERAALYFFTPRLEAERVLNLPTLPPGTVILRMLSTDNRKVKDVDDPTSSTCHELTEEEARQVAVILALAADESVLGIGIPISQLVAH
jgi:hypothetical protein